MNLIKFIKSLRPTSTKDMIEEFTRLFPNRCMICAYHQFGVRECFTKEPFPKPHHCIEK